MLKCLLIFNSFMRDLGILKRINGLGLVMVAECCWRSLSVCYFSFIFGSFTFRIIIVRDIMFSMRSVMNGVVLLRYW